MTDNPNPTPAPKPKGSRSAQDQALANRINEYRTRWTAASANAELMARLQPRGFDAAAFTEGIAKCDAAQVAFNARQTAIDAQKEAAVALNAADKAARAGYADFRKIAQGVFRENATAKAALCLPERQLQDQQKFLTDVTAAYNSALTHSTYLVALTKRGYDTAAINAELAKLQAVVQANADHAAAQKAATRATQTREAAAKALDDWWADLRPAAEVALKDRPDLLGLLGL